MTTRHAPLRQEHLDRIDVGDANGCWLWTGVLNASGYGRYSGVLVHRITFEHWRGEIPEGLEIDHLCRVRRCVNPWHLEAVTPYENWRRGLSPARLNALRTHCKRGHEYTPDNVILVDGRHRRCRTCEHTMRHRFIAGKHKHGVAGYGRGCRCDTCVRLATEKAQRRRVRAMA